MKKNKHRLIYGFMSLLIILNALTPLSVLAQDQPQDTFRLESIDSGKDEQSLAVKVTLAEQQAVKVKASAPIKQAVLEQNGQQIPLTVEQKQTIDVPQTAAGEAVIHLSLDQSQDSVKHFELSYGQQVVTYDFPSASTGSETAETTEKTSETTRETTTSSTQVTSSSEPATSSSDSSTTSTSEPKSKKLAPQAEGPTDIRTYFPGGSGTILTGSEIIYLDKDGHVIEPPVPANTDVRISYTWSIPEDIRKQIQAGDYFEFKLPDELKPKNAMNGELKNDAGEVYATYTIDKDGNVRFTFTDEVKNQSDINGTFYFDTHFDTSHIDGPGDITLHYPEIDGLPPVDVEIRPDTEQSIDKKGQFDRTPNPSQVQWTVDFNQAMNHLTDAKITENWPKGINYKSVKVMELVMNLDGTVKEVGRELSPDEYTVDANGNVTIKGETNKAYRLVYQTDIDPAIVPEDGGKVSFTNTASLTSKEHPNGIDAKATVTNSYGKTIEKNRDNYDPTTQTFDWSIKYNYNEKKIAEKDATITDTLSGNMDLVDGSVKVYPITFDKDGKEVKGTPLEEGKDYVLEPNPNGHGFEIKFLHDVDGAIKIEYQSKVNGLVTDPTQVSNDATIGTGQSDGDTGTANQQNVVKNRTDVDYTNRLVGWKINVNKNHYYMKNLILKDTYSPIPGLSLAKKADGSYDFTIRDVTKNTVLKAGEDYELTLNKNTEGETGFTVTFKNNYNPTESELAINYHTTFDVSLLDPDNPKMDHFTNDISADWQDQAGGDHHSDDGKDFKPSIPYQLNAKKDGVYNAQTKRITWTIAVNLSGNELVGAFLRDPVISNQDYVKDSVKVYEAQVEKDGTVVKKQPETVVNDQMKAIQQPTNDNDQTLGVDFPEGSKETYLIEFETSIEGKLVEGAKQYDNKATYENKKDSRDVIGEVGVENGGKLVQKTGEQDPQNPDYVNWHATINPSQSTMDHVVVTDEPSENQVIDQKSIKMYEMTVAPDGKLTPDFNKPLRLDADYTVALTTENETGKQLLTITFTHQIERAYQLEYRSYIMSTVSGNQDKVSNKITVTGENNQTVSGGDGSDVTVQVDHSGGSASGKKGKLTIQKTEADKKTALSGAQFQLWDTTKSQMLREGTVDANGRLTFGALPYGQYLLIESKAPDGFTISDELANGLRVTINDQTSATGATPLTIPNDRSKVVLQKVDEAGNPIKLSDTVTKGARFKLERLRPLANPNTLWQQVPLNPDTMDADGTLTIYSLQPGLYRITEIAAPTGYVLNTTPTYFVVYHNSKQQIPTVYATYKNYQGSAQLIKQDSTGNPLQGAEFDVLDSQGHKVNQTPLVSDADGKVTINQLAPGNYRFKETKAPTGYVLNTQEVPFTIADSANGKPAMVTTQPDGSALTLKNYQGSAAFIKKNDSGKTLAGAAFDLFNAKNEKINSTPITSDADGKVRVDHLAPGDYTLVETKAPDGYLLNNQKISFTIAASHAGTVPVKELADYVNYQGAFELVKKNTSGETLAGAEFTLYEADKKTLNQTATSGENGKVRFDHLAPGVYYYQETKAPKVSDGADYVVNPALIRVEVPTHFDGDPKVFELGDFQNFRGKAEVTKVGDGGSIAGAEFALTRIVDGEEQPVKNIVVPENGKLDLEGLGAGSYKLVEIKAAPGYIINDQPIYFVVKENDDQNPIIDNLNFNNYQVEVIGKKVNERKEALAGANYQVFKAENGKPMGVPLKITNRQGTLKTDIQTDKNGEIYFKGLEQGEYVLVETTAPKGYILDTQPHPFTIVKQTGKPQAVELGNFINYQGTIEFVKKDEQGQALKGAEFEILDKDDQVQTVLDAKGQPSKTLVSDKAGKVSANGLKPGNYTLVETKAPEGYLINSQKVEFEIKATSNGKSAVLTLDDFINYQGAVKLKKVSTDGNVLSGAVFGLYQQSGKQLKTITTAKDGTILVDKLAPGKYYFKEIKAPEGYQLSKQKHSFTIATANQNKPATIDLGKIINQRIPATPQQPKTPKPTTPRSGSSVSSGSYPKTNDSKNPWFMIIGLVLIGLVAVVYYKRKKD